MSMELFNDLTSQILQVVAKTTEGQRYYNVLKQTTKCILEVQSVQTQREWGSRK